MAYRFSLPTLLLPLVVSVGVACDDDPPTSPADAGADTHTDVQAAPPVTAVTAVGTYAVDSPMDISALALASESTAKKIQLLKSLRDDPAATLFQALDDAGIPLVNQLYGVLPDLLKDKVKGWINDYLRARTLEGRGLPSELDELLAAVEAMLLQFHLLTDLELPATASAPNPGTPPPLAHHLIRGIRYEFVGGRLPVFVPRLVDRHTLVNAETDATARVTTPAPSSDGTLALGDHSFGIPFGDYVLAGLDQITHERYGAPLRGSLGRLFDCPGLGTSVASKCVGPVCVGHAGQLTEICEKGLDQVVAKIQEGIQSVNFNAVRLQSGQAQLWDTPAASAARDGQADRISAGVWQALIDAGAGPRPINATFSGTHQ